MEGKCVRRGNERQSDRGSIPLHTERLVGRLLMHLVDVDLDLDVDVDLACLLRLKATCLLAGWLGVGAGCLGWILVLFVLLVHHQAKLAVCVYLTITMIAREKSPEILFYSTYEEDRELEKRGVPWKHTHLR